MWVRVNRSLMSEKGVWKVQCSGVGDRMGVQWCRGGCKLRSGWCSGHHDAAVQVSPASEHPLPSRTSILVLLTPAPAHLHYPFTVIALKN